MKQVSYVRMLYYMCNLIAVIHSSLSCMDESVQRNLDLVSAAANGNYALVCQLLDKKADPNTTIEQEGNSRTSLLEAIKHAYLTGDNNVAKLLLQRKASPHYAQRQDGKTALILAAELGNTELVEFLRRYKANPAVQDKRKRRALDYAKTDEIKQLLTQAHVQDSSLA